MSREGQALPLDALLTKDITVRGFSLGKYLAAAPATERSALISAALGVAGKVQLTVQPFGDFAAALKKAQGLFGFEEVAVCESVARVSRLQVGTDSDSYHPPPPHPHPLPLCACVCVCVCVCPASESCSPCCAQGCGEDVTACQRRVCDK